ncbi:MAG: DedA family protein [Campylobacterales bacterium]|nr:DedA family protein [Campylobacterales bacterium]
MEELLIGWLKEYGYIILFFWSITEGEIGLIMAGILSHTGDMWVPAAIFVAGLGGFVGDQIYFYIGRYNRNYIYKKLYTQRRKFAIAHLLLKKYGWPLIFVQRYMYGMRTIIPMSIGLTRYSAKKFALINLLSAWAWAAMTIIPAYYLGDEIIKLLEHAKAYWYLSIPVGALFAFSVWYFFHSVEKSLSRRKARDSEPLSL